MRMLKTIAAVALFATLAAAQHSKAAGPADVLSTVEAHKSLTMFRTSLISSGVASMLRSDGPFTVIAPTDQAFANVPKDEMQKLLTHPAAMNFLLARYVVRGNIASRDAAGFSSAKTLMGVNLRSENPNGELTVNGAKIVEGDIRCANGVVHVVNSIDFSLVREAIAIASPAPTLTTKSQTPKP